jgi:pimeloyl-ACP methyl ester carboxylesterase
VTTIFLHGAPETGVIWNGVRRRLERDGTPTEALDLPGFGAPRPAGFDGTKEAYARWLADAVRDLDGPVDLVGHDWGAALVLRVVTALDVAVRSWAVDCASVMHREFVWHDMAQILRTSGTGEKWTAEFVAAPGDAGGNFGSPGWLKAAVLGACPEPADTARIEAAMDETMGRSILDLYRSATPNIFADWGEDMSRPTSAAGLVLRATADVSDDPVRSAEMAANLGADTAELDGSGHWWMMKDPDSAVAVLQKFWSSL